MANQEKLLIIVESPSKTKTISKYVDHAKVIASIGHFKDLPKKELGIDIEKDFAMNVQTLSDRKKFITELKNDTKNENFESGFNIEKSNLKKVKRGRKCPFFMQSISCTMISSHNNFDTL